MWVDFQWLFSSPRDKSPSSWIEGRGGVAAEEEGLAVDISARGLASHRRMEGKREMLALGGGSEMVKHVFVFSVRRTSILINHLYTYGDT